MRVARPDPRRRGDPRAVALLRCLRAGRGPAALAVRAAAAQTRRLLWCRPLWVVDAYHCQIIWHAKATVTGSPQRAKDHQVV
jgi:DNA-binding transcriptional LysR family regulator